MSPRASALATARVTLAAALCVAATPGGPRAALPTRVAPAPATSRAQYVLSRPGLLALAAPSHAVAGFEQRARLLRDGRTELTVVVSPAPLASRAPWPADPDRLLPALAAHLELDETTRTAVAGLAEEISAGARTQAEVSERILTWVSLNVGHAASPRHDESAAATLRAGAASCVGRSTLAVALLRSVGVPARSIHSLRPPADAAAGSVVGSAEFVLHRHVESWVDDSAWLPSDPGESVHVVDARHVVLAVAGSAYDPESQRHLHVRVVSPGGRLRSPTRVPSGERLLVRPLLPAPRTVRSR